MIPRFENITELQLWLLWELMQGDQRREVAEAYLKTAAFKELCDRHRRPDLPARLLAGTDAKLAALFHKVYRSQCAASGRRRDGPMRPDALARRRALAARPTSERRPTSAGRSAQPILTEPPPRGIRNPTSSTRTPSPPAKESATTASSAWSSTTPGRRGCMGRSATAMNVTLPK